MKRRVVRISGGKDNKKIRNAVKLEQNGIKFKSKLELFCYNQLLNNNINNFGYEEHKFVLQEPFTYNNESVEYYKYTHTDETGNSYKKADFNSVSNNIRAITYTPDFCVINDDKTGWVIETKGFKTDSFTIKWKMFKKHLINNGYNLCLYSPNNQGNVIKCIDMIKLKYYT